jgi:hypothetical protein
MTDTEVGREGTQALGGDEGADSGLLLGCQLASAAAIPRSWRHFTPGRPPRGHCGTRSEVQDWHPAVPIREVLKVRVRPPSLPPHDNLT